MTARLEFQVPTAADGQLLREVIRRHMHISRSHLSTLKTLPDGIRVNGQRSTVRRVVKTGDVISLRLNHPDERTHITPEALPLEVVYEDADALVVNKPPGQKMYPRYAGESGSLAAAVLFHLAQQHKDPTFHPVSRLDAGTAGVVLLAKNRYAAACLQKSAGDKRYAAVVFGHTPVSGRLALPIAKRNTRVAGLGPMHVHPAGRAALTEYDRLWYDESRQASGLQVRIATGRRHQIRVHMAHIGHPLWGDTEYGGPPLSCTHPLLWAIHVAFTQLRTGLRIEAAVTPISDDPAQAWAWSAFVSI